jgi:hypothetical protein
MVLRTCLHVACRTKVCKGRSSGKGSLTLRRPRGEARCVLIARASHKDSLPSSCSESIVITHVKEQSIPYY